METAIIVTFRVEGFHQWKDAKKYSDEVEFLSNQHRHVFHFKMWKSVEEDDREIEIILFKRKAIKTIKDEWGIPAQFGNLSCEQIGKILVEKLELDSCEVLEDGENGALVWRERGECEQEYDSLEELEGCLVNDLEEVLWKNTSSS